jgi:cell division protein FtsZ
MVASESESHPKVDLHIRFADETAEGIRIVVVGVGGGGCNAVGHMVGAGARGVELIAANTDTQSLRHSSAPVRLQLGPQLTRGLGAGADPEIGRVAALGEAEKLTEMLSGADLVFIVAGMGGGTGTGGAPVVATIAKDLGALTVAIVTKPFAFEGARRMKNAKAGIGELLDCCDTVITIPNDNLLHAGDRTQSLAEAFSLVDDVLCQAVGAVSDLITTPGLINVDFADVRAVMGGMGRGLMGAGYAAGENRAIDAALQAISSPLNDGESMRGAQCLLLNITGGRDLTLHEVSEAALTVTEFAHPEANIIFGAVLDESMEGTMKVTVISTGVGRATVSSLSETRKRREGGRSSWLPGAAKVRAHG